MFRHTHQHGNRALTIRGGRIDPNIDSIDTNVGIDIRSILS